VDGKVLNPRTDPAAAHAVLVLATATSDQELKVRLVREMGIYLKEDQYDYTRLSSSLPKLPKAIGGNIVYVARPMLADTPAWVPALTSRLVKTGTACYDPTLPLDDVFSEETTLGRTFAVGLNTAVTLHEGIRLPPWVQQPKQFVMSEIQEALRRLRSDDMSVVRALSSYILMRSRVVIADLNTPSFGGALQELGLAEMAGIPIIGVSNRVTISPWVTDVVTAVVPADVTKLLTLLRTWLFL